MPIAPERPRPDADSAAHREAAVWLDLTVRWQAELHPDLWADVPATEAAVVRHFDPSDDLVCRMEQWRYGPRLLDLSDVALFAAGLARAEADAWQEDRPHIAAMAYEARRHLVGDRLLHWAVPWFDMVARCYPEKRTEAQASQNDLLAIGDAMRPAPVLSGSEGLVVPGFDSYGPMKEEHGRSGILASVWSGLVLSARDLSDIRHLQLDDRWILDDWLGDEAFRQSLAVRYREAGGRWFNLTAAHPGSAQLWRDLAHRADRTADHISRL